MQKRQALLLLLLVPFATYSTWVMWEIGYFGIWAAGFETLGSAQILWDLAIACALVCTWIKHDAQARGRNPYPWMVATLATGSLAPLLYLLTRSTTSNQTLSAPDASA